MFDNLKNMAGLMGQAKQMQENMQKMQEELAHKSVTAESGAGAVRITMNGKFEVLNVEVDRAMVVTLAGQGSDADKDMVEQLLASAFNAALDKAQQMAREEMSKLTGGLNIPGLDQMLDNNPGG